MQFYTYTYLSKHDVPYYVGKGQGKRAYTTEQGHIPPKDRSKIQISYFEGEDIALAFEMYLIDFWGRQDLGTGVLRNRTDGGDKPPSQKGRKRSEESLKRISASQMGKKLSEETCRKISEAGMGRKLPLESRQKIAKAATGRKVSEDTKRKLSEINIGHKISEEHLQKLIAANTGRVVSAETRDKISKSNAGKKRSEEARKNISDAHKKSQCIRGHDTSSLNSRYKDGNCKACHAENYVILKEKAHAATNFA